MMGKRSKGGGRKTSGDVLRKGVDQQINPRNNRGETV